MGLILLAVVCAALTGRACGGRLARLTDGPVRGWRLLAICLSVQVLAIAAGAVGLPTGPVYGLSVVLGGATAGLFCLLNRNVQGVGLAGLGLLLNLLVIGLNGAMPVSGHALARAGASLPGFTQVEHTVANHRTVLRPLGDVVPMPLPVHPEVDSVGDLLLAAGAAQFLLTGMLGWNRGSVRLPRSVGRSVRTRPGSVRPRLPRDARLSTGTAVGNSGRSYRDRDGGVEADSALVRVITDLPADGPPIDQTGADPT